MRCMARTRLICSSLASRQKVGLAVTSWFLLQVYFHILSKYTKSKVDFSSRTWKANKQNIFSIYFEISKNYKYHYIRKFYCIIPLFGNPFERVSSNPGRGRFGCSRRKGYGNSGTTEMSNLVESYMATLSCLYDSVNKTLWQQLSILSLHSTQIELHE